MPPDFLNSREDAALCWAVVLLIVALRSDVRGMGTALFASVRTVLGSKLSVLFGGAFFYSAAVVWVAEVFGLWHSTALKATIYWFIGTAVVLAGVAVTEGARSDRALLWRAIGGVASVTILMEFVANLYAFPFVIEFLAVPVIFGLLFAEKQRAIQVVGLGYIAYFIYRALSDLDGFLTRENAEEFLVGPALTIALFPYLLVMARWSRHEQRNFRRRFRARLGSPT